MLTTSAFPRGTRTEAVGHLRTLAGSVAGGSGGSRGVDEAARWLTSVASDVARRTPWHMRRDAGRHCLIVSDDDLAQHMIAAAMCPTTRGRWADDLARGEDGGDGHGHLAYLRTVLRNRLDRGGLVKPTGDTVRGPQAAVADVADLQGVLTSDREPLSDQARAFADIEKALTARDHDSAAFSRWLSSILTAHENPRAINGNASLRISDRVPSGTALRALDRIAAHHGIGLSAVERDRFAVLAGVGRPPVQTVLRWLLLIKVSTSATPADLGADRQRDALLTELSRRPEDWPHLSDALRARGYTRDDVREVLAWADKGTNEARKAPRHLAAVIRAFTTNPSTFAEPGCRIAKWHPDHPRAARRTTPVADDIATAGTTAELRIA